MIDPKLFRNDLDNVVANLARRGFDFDSASYLALEEQRKSLQIKTQELQNERKVKSKLIGQAKAKGEDAQPILDAVANLGQSLDDAKNSFEKVQAEFSNMVGFRDGCRIGMSAG